MTTEQNFCSRCGSIDSIHTCTPPQHKWVSLTNNDLQPIADEYRILFGSWVEDFARAIEAKLKEKNNGIILTGEMLLKAAQSSLSPEQYDHFEAMSKHQPDIYDRLAYAIRVQDE